MVRGNGGGGVLAKKLVVDGWWLLEGWSDGAYPKYLFKTFVCKT